MSHRTVCPEGTVRDKAIDLLPHSGITTPRKSGAFGDMFIPWSSILMYPCGDGWKGWQCPCTDVTGKQTHTKPNGEGGFFRCLPLGKWSQLLSAKNVTKNGVGPTTFKLPTYRLIKLNQPRGSSPEPVNRRNHDCGTAYPGSCPEATVVRFEIDREVWRGQIPGRKAWGKEVCRWICICTVVAPALGEKKT